MTWWTDQLFTSWFINTFFLHFDFLIVLIDGRSVELIISSRGKLQLLVDGFKFFRNSIELNKQSFRCVYYKSTLKWVEPELKCSFCEWNPICIDVDFVTLFYICTGVRLWFEPIQTMKKLIWSTQRTIMRE